MPTCSCPSQRQVLAHSVCVYVFPATTGAYKKKKTAKRQHTNSQKHAVDTAHSIAVALESPLSAAFYVDTKNFSFPGQPAVHRKGHPLSLSFSAKKRRKLGKIQQTFSRISKNNFYATLSQKKSYENRIKNYGAVNDEMRANYTHTHTRTLLTHAHTNACEYTRSSAKKYAIKSAPHYSRLRGRDASWGSSNISGSGSGGSSILTLC